jgi:hypothetical protein
MLSDLDRPHPFAFERVGFAYAATTVINNNHMIITFTDYLPVEDEDYIDDEYVGAKINANAIRKSMQYCLDNGRGGFHVHIHNHKGKPVPSKTDNIGLPGVVDSLKNVTGNQANGILILSQDSFYAIVKSNDHTHYVIPEIVSVVGYPMKFQFNTPGPTTVADVYTRQSFLGKNSTSIFENIRVGIVGLGGGGSHIAQQLAHIGVKNIVVFDDDKIEDSNLNRLVGGQYNDLEIEAQKTSIANRLILGILPTANVVEIQEKWQSHPEELQKCDIVFGCVDTYIARQQLEAECRRYLIPFIDIGMDVYQSNPNEYHMSGQIILSMPGMPGMQSMGFLTEEKLAVEAAKYGNVGGRPQVIWPNGVLASSAIGVFVDIVTGWSGQKGKLIYLSYDGNAGTLTQHLRLSFIDNTNCEYDLKDTGKAQFKKL